ncbi:MAG TPA: two-component regulator propeller domain-containing protein, partial [Ignavibacteriaceae bacterium]|nr:two-component regulator propeller domain-containing protein [Ignavibacteriaceae bacterium]
MVSTLYGQKNRLLFSFSHFTTKDGLSSNNVNSVIQDQKGFLWIGTEDGLNRFDGYSFKVYRNKRGDKSSLSNNFIWSLCEDKDGKIWIGTDGGGLNRFDPVKEKFERFVHDENDPNSVSSNIIQSVFVDSKNFLWISTWAGGLNLFDRKTNSFKRFRNNPDDEKSIGSDKIFFAFEDSKSRIWIGTEEGGLNLFDDKTQSFKKYKHNPADKNSISFNNATSMIELADYSFLIGTFGGGLNRFYSEQNKFEIINTGEIKNIWKVYQEKNGLVWCGSASGEGVCVLSSDLKTFTILKVNKTNPAAISSNDIRTFYEDRTGVLWIGTVAGGLNKIDRKPKKFFQINESNSNLSDNFVFTLEEDNENNIWIGTYNKGLVKFNPDKYSFRTYIHSVNKNGKLYGEIVRYLYNDSKNNLWIGTYYGELNKYNPINDKFDYINLDIKKSNPSANLVRTIYEDSEGLLWFGAIGGGGLTSYNQTTNEFKYYSAASQESKKLSGDDITSICEDNDGNLWIGTYSFGLNRFDKKTNTFKHYFREENNPSSLPDNIITDMLKDSEGNLWVGTYSGGLCRYNFEKDNFEIFSEENGFASNSVYGILEDDNKNLWLSTSRGITKFNYQNVSVKNYDDADGVQKPEFNPSARLKTTNGYMYFGGVEGITFFHPDSIKEESYSSNISVTSFKVFNEEKILSANITFTDSITLSYDENVFSFEFASLDFTSPEKNNYSYMLEGFDPDWVNTGNRRYVNYTHLDPGEYVFKVKATNSTRNWSLPASILLIIEPPFWMTWWFRAIVLILFLSIGPLIYYRRVNQLKKEKSVQVEFSKQLIQSQEDERKRIASELHDSLGQDLLVIKNLALLNKKKDDQFEEISKTASLALDEVRRISYNLHPYQLDRLGLSRAISSMFGNIEAASTIKFELRVDNVDNLFSKERE